ncbi:MAG: hypothetical protein KatS3mg034_2134 [Vicingaceae bacterium]|nr:MAG: hypothetical protein KatS3mg034_2134 [Vicingaceae bacterium]
MNKIKIGVAGAGTMGSGIAQLAATFGHETFLYDAYPQALQKAAENHKNILTRLEEKGKLSEEEKNQILKRIHYSNNIEDFDRCGLIIEAIVENTELKQDLFRTLESLIDKNAILATNTSSLSVTSIGGTLKHQERFLGLHFFNPAPLMPLVEIIPSIATHQKYLKQAKDIVESWGKTTVIAKDTPGFIVNKVARPFYGEALRIYEEGLATFAEIDQSMKKLGGFKMGPFELMDFIGNDINYKVTESVFEAFYFDPRYKPSFTQKRMVEAGRLGRKTGIGYYDYSKPDALEVIEKAIPKQFVFERILFMLINEAADTLFWNIATAKDIDIAVTKGVNYPKGLLSWADSLGLEKIRDGLDLLYDKYREDRYRCCPLIREMAQKGKNFFK